MSEIQRIMDQLDRAYKGDAWHGLPVSALLEGITARQAAAKPVPGGHSIWELTLHISLWQNVARRRLGTEVVGDPPPEVDWPPITNPSEAAWQEALEGLEQSYQNLRIGISQLSETRLDEIVPGKPYSIYVLLHGVIQHDLYHAGQIAILKKLTPP
jgi:uncharacterized damage-inducible protein DinB